MKKRFVYALLFGIPGLLVAGIAALFLSGGVIGVLWLFVFGDDPWPVSVEAALPFVFGTAFLLLWTGCLALGYRLGSKLEADPVMNRGHILLSAGVTALLLLFILLQQWSVGNLGPQTGSARCGDYCLSRGYSASGTPSQNSGVRICSCYDDAGREALQVPLDEIAK